MMRTQSPPEAMRAKAAPAEIVPHNRLTLGPQEAAAASAAVASGQWAAGPRVAELEQALAARARVAHGVAVANGSAALLLAMRAVGVTRGTDVLVPAYSCPAIANAVLALGARPVPVGVRPSDWNIDPRDAVRRRTSRTSAIVAVHTFGAPAAINDLRSLGVPVVEDCSHAFGLDLEQGTLGGLGDAAVLSLYATKLLAAGEGGVVLTDRAEVAESVREARDYRDRPAGAERCNAMMTDIEAALGLVQLARLDDMLACRECAAARYDEWLVPLAEAGVLRLPPLGEHRVWYRYVVELTSHEADRVVEAMNVCGVRCAQPVSPWSRREEPHCPHARRALRRLLSLPLYPTLRADEQRRVVTALEETLSTEPMDA